MTHPRRTNPEPVSTRTGLASAWRLLAFALLLVAGTPIVAASRDVAASAIRPTRIVSINPSLSAILVAIGAGGALVGVDDYSASTQPELGTLPRVGGLFNPSLEAVLALRPDLVVLVPSAEQRDFRARLASLGIRVEVFENIHFDEVLENIERLGRITGREAAAGERVAAIARARRAAQREAARRESPRVLLVLQREPIFVVGRGSFIDEMLRTLGAENIAGVFAEAYPRVAAEWVVAHAPDVLVDLSPSLDEPTSYWRRWPSLPAVANQRVMRLAPELVSMPGPYLDRSLELLAEGLYGARFVADMRAAAVEREALP